eukprot:7790793-Pyramimonas_sp.AAC.1
MNQLYAAGQCLEMAEVLDAKEVSDHAPVFIQLSSSPPRPVEDIPIPKTVCEHPEFRVFLERIWDLAKDEYMTPPMLLDFHTRMIREAARHVRNLLIRRFPGDLFARHVVLKSIARAVWRQDVVLAGRILGSHPLGDKYLELDPISQKVSLKTPNEYLLDTYQTHKKIADKEEGE